MSAQSEITPRQVMAQHGKSFHWAGRALAGPDLDRCALLYAFCRRVDDAVDLGDAASARDALARLRRDVDRGTSDDPLVACFLALAREVSISEALIHAFLDGVATDLEPARFRTETDLVRYAYGVASTVGLMMCAVLGVREREALPFAIDLGVAMQLTNVCRDVFEDAQADRLYLPRRMLQATTTVEAIRAGDRAAWSDARRAVGRVLTRAHHFYRSADRGMRFLPRRARLAILIASRVYEGIGDEILAQPPDGFDRRAVVGRWRKLRLTLRALAAFAFHPRYWRLGRAARHEAQLHGPLRSLPGANPAA
ncbi:MAG: phytoene/squalene synthase family protein [Myxococcota bacterium]|nr:phytoene/squalene synthase family protein [Myxococcota bacterium]